MTFAQVASIFGPLLVVIAGLVGWLKWTSRKVAQEEAAALLASHASALKDHDRNPYSHPESAHSRLVLEKLEKMSEIGAIRDITLARIDTKLSNHIDTEDGVLGRLSRQVEEVEENQQKVAIALAERHGESGTRFIPEHLKGRQ